MLAPSDPVPPLELTPASLSNAGLPPGDLLRPEADRLLLESEQHVPRTARAVRA